MAGETWVSRTRRQAGETRRADAAAVDLEAETQMEAPTEAETGEDRARIAIAADSSVDDPASECTPAEFTLFVTGDSEISRRALVSLRNLCNERLSVPATMLIIDTGREPAIAELNGVSHTPTLIKHGPGPTRRCSGDLSNSCAVMACLEFPRSCVRSDAPFLAPTPALGDAAAR
ncbi:MAG TPA: circadian clock KaiB family protein [Gemmatimonadaceae bacterium]